MDIFMTTFREKQIHLEIVERMYNKVCVYMNVCVYSPTTSRKCKQVDS